MTKLIIFGAGGRLGRLAIAEARRRGHQLTAVVRDPTAHADLAADGVALVAGDVLDADRIATIAAGHDAAIVSLYQTAIPHDRFYGESTGAVLAGLGRAGVGRLAVVGLSPNLESSPGVRLMDDPAFPPEHLPFVLGHTVALHVLRAAPTPIDWVMLTPPEQFDGDGERTGRYRTGGDAPLRDGDDPTSGSYADFAIALVDEATEPVHHRTRIAVAA